MWVTRSVRDIYETAKSKEEIERRLRGLVEYMKWKSEETLAAYQHYFDEQLDADTHNAFHQRLHEEIEQYLAERKLGKQRQKERQRQEQVSQASSLVPPSLISPFCMLSQGRRNMARKTSKALSEYTWQCLEGKFAQEVLRAPKTGGDPQAIWPAVHERIVRYLLRSVAGTPWADHVALIAAVLSARRRDVSTVEQAVRTFNTRFRALFQVLDLKTVDEWNADRHLPLYLKGEIIVEDSRS